MKTLLVVLLLAVLVVGMLAPPADAWGRHGYRYWTPLDILFAPLVVAGALVTAPFVIAGSAIAAATPPPDPVYAPYYAPAYAPAPAYAAPVAAYRRPVAAYPPPPPPPPPPAPAYQAPVAAYPSAAMVAAAPAAPSYWYYCQNPGGYYPYVSECPGGWLTVTPR